jgi:lipopolysaccharide transport system ATP-binding protein
MRMQGAAKSVCEAYHAKQYDAELPITAEKPRVRSRTPDFRQAMFDASSLRNDLRVFRFDSGTQFGDGSATIESIELQSRTGGTIGMVTGGERVSLRIQARANAPLRSPIIGFHFKDRLGQVLFAENTYLTYADNPVMVEPGQTVVGTFDFMMPILPRGHYTVDIAIAEGTYDEHVQAQWLHDALMVESHSTSVSIGLVGIPFDAITLQAEPRE